MLTITVTAEGDMDTCQKEVQKLANLLEVRVEATCWPKRRDSNSVPIGYLSMNPEHYTIGSGVITDHLGKLLRGE